MAGTEHKLAELMGRELSGFKLAVLMIEGCPSPSMWWIVVSGRSGCANPRAPGRVLLAPTCRPAP